MKIIVLCPVKNEEWILEVFLKACSLFADHIIIADQNSTDRSRIIASSFDKVVLIQNKIHDFNEADRQILLIDKARELYGFGNLLIALDADEIISANSLESKEWYLIRNSSPGTICYFDKPTPIFDKPLAISYKDGFPLGYVDDGATHKPTLIHSSRLPSPPNAKIIKLKEIVFLHLTLVRKNVQFSKNRYYCVLENINNTKKLRHRWLMYRFYNANDYLKDNIIKINPDWYNYGGDLNIQGTLNYPESRGCNYVDYQTLILLNKYGYKRFFKDPIWKFDWEKCRLTGLNENIPDLPTSPITPPSKLIFHTTDSFFRILNYLTYKHRSLFSFFRK